MGAGPCRLCELAGGLTAPRTRGSTPRSSLGKAGKGRGRRVLHAGYVRGVSPHDALESVPLHTEDVVLALRRAGELRLPVQRARPDE